jgi:group I intron endonuclease
MKIKVVSGVYYIRNSITEKTYYGSSINIERRWKQHIYDLEKNGHYNYFLQKEWNTFGPDFFEFEILEEIKDTKKMVLREQYYIDLQKINQRIDHEKCFNIAHGANSLSGANNPMWGKKHSSETKEKIGEKSLGRIDGQKNPQAKLTSEKVILIREEYNAEKILNINVRKRNNMYCMLAKKYGVNRCTIRDIMLRRTWKEI